MSIFLGMGVFSIFSIAVGLAMDACAVSITSGTSVQRVKPGNAIIMAALFGSFQALMPVAGWFLGRGIHSLISSIDHWIAFGLLGLIGGKMIIESFNPGHARKRTNPFQLDVLVLLALATSIDAFCVGISLSLLCASILLPVIVIGSITFFLSLISVYVGKKLGDVLRNKVEFLGGVILICIGFKILIEHL